MTEQTNMEENWIQKYCTRVGRRKMECNICHHISSGYLLIKVHLYRKHEIFCDEDVDRSNLVWRYFKEEERYAPTCKLCGKVLLSGYMENNLEIHLISRHSQILKEIRNKIKCMWVSQHFELNVPGHKIKCKICSNMCNIFKVHFLTRHLLQHGITEKPKENTEENNINMNQSVAEESNVGTTFHQTADTHLQDQENVNFDLQSASIRPQQENMQENWIRRYCTKVGTYKECNICHYATSYSFIKVHLYREHGIFCEENVDRSNLVWRYFKEEERYAPTCKLCDKVLFSGYKENTLEIHLISKHPQTIKEIRTEITRMWVSQHFKLDPSGHMIKCKICSNMCNIFKVNSLVKHLLKHGVREKPVENTEENSINVNHSAAEESNMGTSFHQIDTHSQDEENVNDLQSASIRPKQKKAMQKNWIWKYCTRVESQKIKCNICHYSIRLFAADYLRIKVHLYREHGIYRDKNMNRSNLIWRYFKEEQKYAPTCKLCDKVLLSGYKENSLVIHLISKHPQTIKEIRTEITRMWVSQHFELGLSSYTIKCKICCKMFNIFKVDILVNHLLKHDIKEKPQENTKENNMNVAINRSAAKENRVVTHSQAQENRKDFERYGANIMPQQKNENKNWIWEHISGAESDEMKCNICHYVTRNFSSTKSHLYHEHGIFHDEDPDRSNLVWQYFTEEERNSPKCKLCNKMFLSEYDEHNLEEHLISVHPLTTKEIRKQIGCIWVSQHFTFSTSSYKIKCKTCCKMFNIFRVDFLVNHLLEHDIKEKPQENTEGNNINVTVNQSVAEENKTDTRLQVQKNGKDLERYCADITQSQKNENENWLWEYFSRAKHSYKMICNICHYVTSNLLFTKIHLYYEHEIFRDEDSDRSNLVWRYFTEGERCIPKCKLCNKMFLSGYDEYNLEQHMIFVHPLTTEKIREEVKRIWVSQHFTFSRLSHEIKCKICYKMFNIFRVDFLLSHLLKHGINKKSQVYTEKNNMNVTINK